MSASGEGETEEQFRSRIFNMTTKGITSLSLALGSQIGLFDLLAKTNEAQTPQEIADAGGLKERYVREWLGTMACAGVVKVTDDGTKFHLPAALRPAVAGITPNNSATFSWVVPILANVTGDITAAFRKDGPEGVPYSRYDGFQEWRSRCMKQTLNTAFLKNTIKMVPNLADKLESGIEMCELGCGEGILGLRMAETFPNTKITALDISEKSIEKANQEANSKSLNNIQFLMQDICDMPADWTDRWDFILAVDVLHDVPFTTKAISEIQRVLKPGSFALVIDIDARSRIIDNKDMPLTGTLYALSLFHCMPVSLNTPGGEGLGTVWGREKAVEMFTAGKFSQVSVTENGAFLLQK